MKKNIKFLALHLLGVSYHHQNVKPFFILPMKRIDENHSLNVNVCTVLGHIQKAILLKEIYGWCFQNKANNRNIKFGLPWSYMTARGYAQKFPYMNEKSIARWLKELEADGWVYSSNFNKAGYDRTKWYTINHEAYDFAAQHRKMLNSQNEKWKSQIEKWISQNEGTIPSSTTSSTTSILKEEAIENCNSRFEERCKQFGLDLNAPTPFDELNEKLKKEKEKNSAKKEKLEDLEYYQETLQILALFTELTGAKFKPPKKLSSFKRYGAFKMVKSLLKQGFKLREIEDVIRFKCKEWLQSSKMAKYCTYQTILLPSNFEKYLTQIQIKPQTNGKQTNNTNNKTFTDIFAEIDARYKQEGFDSTDFNQTFNPF